LTVTYADVGGGIAANTAPHALANIPLRWMVEQIVQSDVKILFDYDEFARWNIPTSIGQDPSQGISNSTDDGANAVSVLDAQDAVQRITDELWKKPLWWILEIFPTSYTYQNAQDKWITTFW
jgi:hypothetical protein